MAPWAQSQRRGHLWGGRLTRGACAQGPAVTIPGPRPAHVHTHPRAHEHAHSRVHADTAPHTRAQTQRHTQGPTHRCSQSPKSLPASENAGKACQHPGPGRGTQSLACPSDPSPPGPQVPPAEPRELEEVLVVVGGRALEDEEAAEGPVPHPGNFAFYDTRASEYSPRPSSGHCPCVLTGAPCLPCRCSEQGARRTGSFLGCLGLLGLQGGLGATAGRGLRSGRRGPLPLQPQPAVSS